MKRNLTRLLKCLMVLAVSLLCVHFAIFLGSRDKKLGQLLHLLERKRFFAQEKTGEIATPHVASEVVRAAETPVRLTSTLTCPGLEMTALPESDCFQSVQDSLVLLYSAFMDQKTVRIVALRPLQTQPETLLCYLWLQLKDQDPLVIIKVAVENIPEHHGRRYTSAFLLCRLPPKLETHVPYAVSIVTQTCQAAWNSVRVQTARPISSQFTVCVTPLNFKYSKAHELVEMIEMNKLLGAQKLVFYNYSTGPNVDEVLQLYSHLGEVDVLPWHLPVTTDTWPPSEVPDIHYFAQLAALNDCLYRYRHQSAYLVFTDLDEFIIPRYFDGWAKLIQRREDQHAQNVSVFQMKCVFYRKEWTRPAKSLEKVALIYHSAILKHTQREARYLPHGTRSKFIVNPQLTSVVGVHDVWQHVGAEDEVPESEAAVHHYRDWESPDDSQPRIVDDIAVRKFGTLLADRLSKVWLLLQAVPLNISLSGHVN